MNITKNLRYYSKWVGILIIFLFFLTQCFCDNNSLATLKDSEIFIITTEEFKEPAILLSNIYKNNTPNYQISIVYKEWVDNNIVPIDGSNLPDGYETNQKTEEIPLWNPEKNTGYNYLLAKKIIAFLQQMQIDGKLRYVTFLGSNEIIPPSYYIRGKEFPPYVFDKYSKFYPTDFFYSSPDLDIYPDISIGRLPARTLSDAIRVITKIDKWYSDIAKGKEWFQQAVCLSGNVYDTRFEPYLGEISVEYSIQKQNANWEKISRYFDSRKQSFNKANIEKLLKEGGVGWIYHVTHGLGYYIAGKNGSVYSNEILEYPGTKGQLPIFVSTACFNGDFDTTWRNKKFSHSIGESLLLSNAGAIAYLGGTRVTAGESRSIIDKSGNILVQDVDYLMQIFDSILEVYYLSDTDSFLGDLVRKGICKYLAWLEKDYLKDNIGLTMLYSFVLLGDPLLKVPSLPREVKHYGMPRIKTQYSKFHNNAFKDDKENKFPVPEVDLQGIDSPLTFEVGSTQAKWLRVQILDINNNVLDECVLNRESKNYFQCNFELKKIINSEPPYQIIMTNLEKYNSEEKEYESSRAWLWIEITP